MDDPRIEPPTAPAGRKTRQLPRPPAVPSALRTVPLLALLLALALPSPSVAGPNEGGVLILHANPNRPFTFGESFCGASELRDCANAVTRVGGDGTPVVFFVLAVFPDFGIPRLKAVSFGVDYFSAEPIAWGRCQDSEEYAEYGWPASGTGVALVWNGEPLKRRLNEIYWFASYTYEGETFKLIPDATYGGEFADDSLPGQTDRVDEYGMLGFGTNGFNPCGPDDAIGACCNRNGVCFIQTRAACEFQRNTYLGDNTACHPNPCSPGMGACCIRTECRLIPFGECIDAGGSFMGQGSVCEPTPCNFTRVETSWGNLKTTYRN